MVNNNLILKEITIENSKICMKIGYALGLQIGSFLNRSTCNSGDLKQAQRELFVLDIEGKQYKSSRFEIMEVTEGEDKTQEMVTVLLREENAGLLSRVCFMNNRDCKINIVIQLSVNWESGFPREVYFNSPFLSNLMSESNEENEYYFPSKVGSKVDGSSILQLHSDFPLPFCIFGKYNGKGFSVQLPVEDNNLVHAWDQNRNHDFIKIKSLEELKNHRILLRPDHTLTDIVEFQFEAVENGWTECFHSWREDQRKNYILEQYEREDLQWYKGTFLHHFSYIYGKEVYDYDTNKIDVKRLLSQGEEFGGYDAILLWHQYPRLGVDQRNQWDFYDDFPGGRKGITETVEAAHQLGVKVFLPFKPWDLGFTESADGATKCIAELIKDTDVDGIFFDTMNSVPKGFREAIDRIRPGVVFCTEAQPHNKCNIEGITGSWDQYWNPVSMPEVNLLRYVLPEHFAPIIARWHVGEKKDMLIKRAVFNGTGIVIWQDIFGSWLPYSEEQKLKIRKWKQILRENKDIFFCPHPIPLYPTLRERLYSNCFTSEVGGDIIYTLYNDMDRKLTGELFVHCGDSRMNVTDLWNGTEIEMINHMGRSIVSGTILSKEILVIKLTKQGVVA